MSDLPATKVARVATIIEEGRTYRSVRRAFNFSTSVIHRNLKFLTLNPFSITFLSQFYDRDATHP